MTTKPRPDTSVILGVSMPAELKARIKALADADDRKMAAWCAIKLREIVAEMEASAPPPPEPKPSPGKRPRTAPDLSSRVVPAGKGGREKAKVLRK